MDIFVVARKRSQLAFLLGELTFTEFDGLLQIVDLFLLVARLLHLPVFSELLEVVSQQFTDMGFSSDAHPCASVLLLADMRQL